MKPGGPLSSSMTEAFNSLVTRQPCSSGEEPLLGEALPWWSYLDPEGPWTKVRTKTQLSYLLGLIFTSILYLPYRHSFFTAGRLSRLFQTYII